MMGLANDFVKKIVVNLQYANRRVIIPCAILIMIIASFAWYICRNHLSFSDSDPYDQIMNDGIFSSTDPIIYDETLSVAALNIIKEKLVIIDVHEHVESFEQAAIYISAMDELGIRKMCLMGSSKFTITLNEEDGFTETDENNEELMKIIAAFPDRFEAWPTVDPLDPNMLDKFQDLFKRGAAGLKLYIGHGYVNKKGEYMFHTLAMDDPKMLPLYAFCETNYIPVCIHVNPYGGKKGFAEEFIAVLTQFPDMKVIAPHFILSSIASERLREFLDTFPNLYSDISFGDYFVADGLKRISKDPDKFRDIFADYPDRFMYGTDLVLTSHPAKNEQWVYDQHKAYIDMLTLENYDTPFIEESLNGLSLPPDQLAGLFFLNYIRFRESQPQNTQITREIDWSMMNQEQTERKPGESFPPEP